MSDSLASSIWALVTFLVSRFSFELIKTYYRKQVLYIQLFKELEIALINIESNRITIDEIEKTSSSWPLLTKVDVSIHDAEVRAIITNSKISESARQFLSNCKHYNRIVDWGDNGVFNRFGHEFTVSKRADVRNQGYLINNKDNYFRLKRGDEDLGAHLGYGDTYKILLEDEINRRSRFLKWIPWLATTIVLSSNSGSNPENQI